MFVGFVPFFPPLNCKNTEWSAYHNPCAGMQWKCARKVGMEGGVRTGGRREGGSSWLAEGLVSMAMCVKRVQPLSLSPVSMLCTKE